MNTPAHDPRHIFTVAGRTFWQDSRGYWGAAKLFDGPPSNCAYQTPEAIAQLKGITLPPLSWAKPADAPCPEGHDMAELAEALTQAREFVESYDFKMLNEFTLKVRADRGNEFESTVWGRVKDIPGAIIICDPLDPSEGWTVRGDNLDSMLDEFRNWVVSEGESNV